MKPSMQTKLQQLARRLEEIDAALSSEDAARDMNRLRSLGQERAEIERVVARFHDYNRAHADLLGAQEMLSDPDMKALAEEETHARATLAAVMRVRGDLRSARATIEGSTSPHVSPAARLRLAREALWISMLTEDWPAAADFASTLSTLGQQEHSSRAGAQGEIFAFRHVIGDDRGGEAGLQEAGDGGKRASPPGSSVPA